MALVIDATVGGASANSYVTVVEADAYFEADLYSGTWDAADNTKKAKALVMATRILDQECSWIGDRADENQALRWPRVNAEDSDGESIDETIVPTAIKNATFELAKSLLSTDRTADPDTEGIKRMKLDVLEFEFDKMDRAEVLPLAVRSIVSNYMSAGGGSMVVDLERA